MTRRLKGLHDVAGAVVRANGAFGQHGGSVASFVVLSCVCRCTSRGGEANACVVFAKSNRFRSMAGCLSRGGGGRMVVCNIASSVDQRLESTTSRMERLPASDRLVGHGCDLVVGGVSCICGGPHVVPAFVNATRTMTGHGGVGVRRVGYTLSRVLSGNCLAGKFGQMKCDSMGILCTR